MTGTIAERVCRVVADVLGVPSDKVDLSTSHKTVDEWDSMAMINMLMALESEFQISISVEEAAKLVSVAAAIAVVQEAGGR
jgi:acyl carrier protein